jgi:hypothetical protein
MGCCVVAVDAIVAFPWPLLRFIVLVLIGMAAYGFTLPILKTAGYDIDEVVQETMGAVVADSDS